MTQIKPNQRFLDEGEAFEEGQEYDVDDDKAVYFAMNGWLAETDADVPADVLGPKTAIGETVELSVDRATHGHQASDL